MATVKDLKEWLEKFSEDTIVEFAIQEEPLGYDSHGPVKFEEPELKDGECGRGWDYTDYTDEYFYRCEHYGKKVLRLGEDR